MPVDHGERHVDQLYLHPRVPQQPLGLDWTIQGDVASMAGSPSFPSLSIIGDHGIWPETTEEFTLVHPRGPYQLRACQGREDSAMASPSSKTTFSLGCSLALMPSSTTD